MPETIFRTVSGNVIGVVEAPETIDPEKSLKEQYLVKIGVLEPARLCAKALIL
jgi:hypothetical protein